MPEATLTHQPVLNSEILGTCTSHSQMTVHSKSYNVRILTLSSQEMHHLPLFPTCGNINQQHLMVVAVHRIKTVICLEFGCCGHVLLIAIKTVFNCYTFVCCVMNSCHIMSALVS